MKNVLVIISFILLYNLLTAQTEKGNFIINGGIGMSIDDRDETSNNASIVERKTTSFSFSPSAGYFIKNNLAAGLNINYQYHKTETTRRTGTGLDIINQRDHYFSGGPFIKYFIPLLDKISFFIYGDATYSRHSSFVWAVDTEINPGLTYFISPNFGIELSTRFFNYRYSKWVSTNFNYMQVGISTGSTSLGASFYF